jgi:hypothetical protein
VEYTDIIDVLDNTHDAVFDTLTVPEHLEKYCKTDFESQYL